MLASRSLTLGWLMSSLSSSVVISACIVFSFPHSSMECFGVNSLSSFAVYKRERLLEERISRLAKCDNSTF